MATASSLQARTPRKNVHASSGVSGKREMNELAMLRLDDQGVIRDCSQACEPVFGYSPGELAGRHISILIPQLQDVELVEEGRINARLAHLCHCAISFQARRRDGHHFAGELFINRLDSHNVVFLVRSLEAALPNIGTFSTTTLS